LSPAKIINVRLDNDARKAEVLVASDQLSLAIGKGGQNVRLAAHLTGWKIDIIEKSEQGEKKQVIVEEAVIDADAETETEDQPAEE